MIPFQERKKIRKIFYSKAFIALLLALLFFVAQGAWGIYQKAQIARSERDIARRTLFELESRTGELQASLQNLKSERGTEEALRQKYTVARPGEEIVVVVDEGQKKGKNSDTPDEKKFWQNFFSFLGF